MSQVNKDVCLTILKRGLRVHHEIASFQGSAKNWQKFSEPDFKEFAKKHSIDAETVIAVYNKGFDSFGVQILR